MGVAERTGVEGGYQQGVPGEWEVVIPGGKGWSGSRGAGTGGSWWLDAFHLRASFAIFHLALSFEGQGLLTQTWIRPCHVHVFERCRTHTKEGTMVECK